MPTPDASAEVVSSTPCRCRNITYTCFSVFLLIKHAMAFLQRSAIGAVQAAVNGHAEVVKQLLAAGADPQQQNKDGKTPADLAKTDAVKAVLSGQ